MKYLIPPSVQRSTSPLGDMLLAATPQGLCGTWFYGQKHMPEYAHWPAAQRDSPEAAHIERAAQQISEYFADARKVFDLTLDLSVGTPFQQTVWRALMRIAYGMHLSYSALALQIARPLAVRAVGTAVGFNPISIIVPCHRVLGADGRLTGYAGGLERKTALLSLEGQQP